VIVRQAAILGDSDPIWAIASRAISTWLILMAVCGRVRFLLSAGRRMTFETHERSMVFNLAQRSAVASIEQRTIERTDWRPPCLTK